MKIDDLLKLLTGFWHVHITDGITYLRSADIDFLRKKCKELWSENIISDLELDDGELVIMIDREETKK